MYMQPCSFNKDKAVSCALGKIGKSKMALKDEQLMVIQHVYTARTFEWLPTNMQVHMYESYRLYSYLASTLERQKWHIAIVDLQATFVHGVAAHCNRIFPMLLSASSGYVSG